MQISLCFHIFFQICDFFVLEYMLVSFILIFMYIRLWGDIKQKLHKDKNNFSNFRAMLWKIATFLKCISEMFPHGEKTSRLFFLHAIHQTNSECVCNRYELKANILIKFFFF